MGQRVSSLLADNQDSIRSLAFEAFQQARDRISLKDKGNPSAYTDLLLSEDEAIILTWVDGKHTESRRLPLQEAFDESLKRAVSGQGMTYAQIQNCEALLLMGKVEPKSDFIAPPAYVQSFLK